MVANRTRRSSSVDRWTTYAECPTPGRHWRKTRTPESVGGRSQGSITVAVTGEHDTVTTIRLAKLRLLPCVCAAVLSAPPVRVSAISPDRAKRSSNNLVRQGERCGCASRPSVLGMRAAQSWL